MTNTHFRGGSCPLRVYARIRERSYERHGLGIRRYPHCGCIPRNAPKTLIGIIRMLSLETGLSKNILTGIHIFDEHISSPERTQQLYLVQQDSPNNESVVFLITFLLSYHTDMSSQQVHDQKLFHKHPRSSLRTSLNSFLVRKKYNRSQQVTETLTCRS